MWAQLITTRRKAGLEGVSEEAPMRVPSPAASRSSAFQRKVVRSRSSAPMRCSTSLPARGGSHG
jgi:hypothetical protein